MTDVSVRNEPLDGDLKCLFDPQSVAVVGVSADPSKPASRAVRFLVQSGVKAVYAIGSRAHEAPGARTLTSVSQLPEPVDVCVIAVRAAGVLDVIKAAHARGVRNFVVFSSGFGESGPDGERLERELSAYCNENRLTVLGPNSLGILNLTGRPSITFASSFEDRDVLPGNTAFVTQSGAVATLAGRIAAEAMRGLSHIVSTGNEACLSCPQIGLYLLKQPEIDSLAIYVEDTRHVAALLELAREGTACGKPVVVLTGGLTESGRNAAASHTGSMSGDMAVVKSLLAAEGAMTVQSPNELVITLAAMQMRNKIGRRAAFDSAEAQMRVATVTNSGGMGVMLSDLLAKESIELSRLSVSTTEQLKSILPPHASLANPIDVTATVNLNPAPLSAAVRCVASDENVDILILLANGGSKRVIDSTIKAAEAAKGAPAPLVVVWPCAPIAGRRALVECGATMFDRIEDASFALAQLRRYLSGPPANPARAAAAVGDRSAVSRSRAAGTASVGGRIPREDVLKADMRAFGISVPDHEIVVTRDAAEAAAQRIGFPAVLKLVAPVTGHKTEIGAVRIDLRDAAIAGRAFDEMHASLSQRFPGEALEFMVEGMATAGVELVISASKSWNGVDVLMVGSGGVAVEAEKDVTFCRAPTSRAQFIHALRRTRVGRFLLGKRGQHFDLDALLDFHDRLMSFFYSSSYRFRELELNPVRVHARGLGIVVLDAVGSLQVETQ